MEKDFEKRLKNLKGPSIEERLSKLKPEQETIPLDKMHEKFQSLSGRSAISASKFKGLTGDDEVDSLINSINEEAFLENPNQPLKLPKKKINKKLSEEDQINELLNEVKNNKSTNKKYEIVNDSDEEISDDAAAKEIVSQVQDMIKLENELGFSLDDLPEAPEGIKLKKNNKKKSK